MTCAHVVNVALQKVVGVETVDVSLNRSRAFVTFKAGNKVTLAQLLRLISEKGYTIKAAIVEARAVPTKLQYSWVVKVSGTGESFVLVPDASKPEAYADLSRRVGEPAIVKGSMIVGRGVKAPTPLAVTGVE